jgi:tetratricopeptide (TPR) repeat protein/tRNA A-37 threonylcarbamoyl transferase component Bud32
MPKSTSSSNLPDLTFVAVRAAPQPPAAEAPRYAGRYRLEEEIATGGMGTVYRAADEGLGRELAVKILRHECAGDAALRARFGFEARIMAQLQHPGIPPVHEVGALADGRPFLAMKLIRGRTLAELLASRQEPSEDLSHFLAIFGHVCQTMAYAHGQGVIHRDLKPSNIMVGAFGEVQVMDWGLAKRVGEALGPPEDLQGMLSPSALIPPSATLPQGPRTGDGGVMGTPAYMAPEQRNGKADARSDVYSLGAILTEVLAGRARPDGSTGFRHMLTSLGMAPGAALDHCTADPALVQIARRCLSPSPDSRPEDAGALAAEVEAYQEGVRERLRQAELARVRSEEQGARRRLIIALAAALILVVGVLFHMRHQAALSEVEEAHRQEARLASAHTSLTEARGHLRRAGALMDDLPRWGAALDAAEASLRAAQATKGMDPQLSAEIVAEKKALADARADLRLLQELADARDAQTRIAPSGTRFEDEAFVPLALEAFARHGLILDGPLDEAAHHVRSRPEPVQAEVIAGLGLCFKHLQPGPSRQRVFDLLELVDDDPWRREVRQAIARRSQTALHALALRPSSALQSPESVLLLARTIPMDDPVRLALLRGAVRHHPGDFWLHQSLGHELCHSLLEGSLPRLAVGDERLRVTEAMGHFRAALALRPNSAGAMFNLASMHRLLGNHQAAERKIRKVIEMDHRFVHSYTALAGILHHRGDSEGAVEALRLGVKNLPDNPALKDRLASALLDAGRPHQAANVLREAMARHPSHPHLHSVLGQALMDLGEKQLGLSHLFHSVLLSLDNTGLYLPLAEGLVRRRHYREAEGLLRFVLRLEPTNPAATVGLADVLTLQRRFDEALPVARLAVQRAPFSHQALASLGACLEHAGDLSGAWEAYRAALTLGESPSVLLGLAKLELHQGQAEKALDLAQRARKLAPQTWSSQALLCQALSALGRGRESFEAARRAVELGPSQATAHALLGLAYLARREPRKALACFTRACELEPSSAQYRFHRAEAYLALRLPARALNEMRWSMSLGAGYPMAFPTASESLGARGEHHAALALARLGVSRHPTSGDCWRGLALALTNQGRNDEALQAAEKAASLAPNDPLNHGIHGALLHQLGRFPEAADATRRAIEKMRPGNEKLGFAQQQLARCLRNAELARRIPLVLAGDGEESDPLDLMEMAALSHDILRRPHDAARLAEMALAITQQPADNWRLSAALYAVAAARASRAEAPAWRGKALAWMTAQAEACRSWPAELREANFQAWRTQAGLASVRGKALDTLPADEREAWRAFWASLSR